MIPLIFLAIPLIGSGVGAAVKGVKSMVHAKNTMEEAQSRNARNLKRYEYARSSAEWSMRQLGALELRIFKNLERFVVLFERIHNRPEFSGLETAEGIPALDISEIRDASITAGALGGTLTGVVLGAVAGVGVKSALAAVGTTVAGKTAAVATGVGAAKVGAALTGGGTIAAMGGATAGAALLGAVTLGVGVLVGGVVLAFTGSSLSSKAREAHNEMLRNEDAIDSCVRSLDGITELGGDLRGVIQRIYSLYERLVGEFGALVERNEDWNSYTHTERELVENNVRIVSILNKLINTPLLVLKEKNASEYKSPVETELNELEVRQNIAFAEEVIEGLGE